MPQQAQVEVDPSLSLIWNLGVWTGLVNGMYMFLCEPELKLGKINFFVVVLSFIFMMLKSEFSIKAFKLPLELQSLNSHL